MRKQRVLINKERKEIIVLESVNAVDEKKNSRIKLPNKQKND